MLDFLPVKQDLEAKEILKKSISANRALAILNETAKSASNRFILINALTLQEAKDSSEIENIITTHDELYKAGLDLKSATKEAKEVKDYQLLREVDTKDNWQAWVYYMLEAVEQTAKNTTILTNDINALMDETKNTIKQKLPKIYSKDLVEILFNHPYTKIEFLTDELNITRKTTSKYLNDLENIGLMDVVKIGREKYFINHRLWQVLKDGVSV